MPLRLAEGWNAWWTGPVSRCACPPDAGLQEAGVAGGLVLCTPLGLLCRGPLLTSAPPPSSLSARARSSAEREITDGVTLVRRVMDGRAAVLNSAIINRTRAQGVHIR
ncbi:hypothetical protein NDU88_001904 [Pleurodeles waltl]|uniref:Uncharacterized protein n=1 Tax=Pleurodeles waltl TaxID=8319 RepID=A0AAV7UAR8_PLEWA|nr:hypothetical protein NDU88_001904 [Pleurodeles waltl]